VTMKVPSCVKSILSVTGGDEWSSLSDFVAKDSCKIVRGIPLAYKCYEASCIIYFCLSLIVMVACSWFTEKFLELVGLKTVLELLRDA